MLLVIHQIDTWSGYDRHSQAREWLTREGTLTRGMSGSIRRECDAMRGAAETEHRDRMSNPTGLAPRERTCSHSHMMRIAGEARVVEARSA